MKVHAVFNRDGGTFRTMDMTLFCRNSQEQFLKSMGIRLRVR